MGFFGGILGQGLGALGEEIFGKTQGIDGQALGKNIGSYLPFSRGGKIPARKRGGVKAPAKKKGGMSQMTHAKKRGGRKK
jgi:hypothetical protein